MNINPENIVVNSCQFTPVYLVQDTGAIQGRYIVTQGNVEEAKPVTDNLKRFYENSGILEDNYVNNAPTITKPRILKKQEKKVIGNSLKLASFLLPNTSTETNIITPSFTTNHVLKPVVIPNGTVNIGPKVRVDRKIVKLKNFPNELLQPPRERTLPKPKPKEEATPVVNPVKHTSVQLLKLGETYHSLNQLNDDQMKMVNKALKIFSNPEQKKEPKYDPATNTQFIYRVVSPKELTVVGKNKINAKIKKHQEIKEEKKKEIQKEIQKDIQKPEEEEEVEIKVTRSGRPVKHPKQLVPEGIPKPKKKLSGVVSCFQCSTDFCSFYRLQKHYENHPTHIPAKVHSNLFHCLLAIIRSGSEEDRTNIFIQQLEQLIEKLKSLLPCLMKKIDGEEGKSCTINDDVGRLFGMNPGKYNLNVEALNCVKTKNGHCRHNPPAPKGGLLMGEINTSIPSWYLKCQDENSSAESETEDCARINSVDKWPTAHKRLWNSKKQKTLNLNAKKMRLASETTDPILELEIEDLVTFSSTVKEQSAISVQPTNSLPYNLDLNVDNNIECNETAASLPVLDVDVPNCDLNVNEIKKTASVHQQFHSTHFDIRSSPIKSSSAVFSKFQINLEKLPKCDSIQVIQPPESSKQNEIIENVIPQNNDSCDFQSIFKDSIIQLSPCKGPSGIPEELTFDTSKEWIMDAVGDKSNESFMKTTGLIEPSLLHMQESSVDKLVNNLVDSGDHLRDCDSQMSNNSSSVLNFLESLGNECLSYPETEIRNNPVENVDFQLDLFSFSNN